MEYEANYVLRACGIGLSSIIQWSKKTSPPNAVLVTPDLSIRCESSNFELFIVNVLVGQTQTSLILTHLHGSNKFL